TAKEHPCTVTYRVTAGGATVMETMSMGKGEMVTMYSPDGNDIVLTHYCMLGNQPRMRAAGEQKPGVLRFTFDGGGNMKPEDQHMHSLTVTFIDDDHIKQEWTMYGGGKEQGVHTIELTRKKKA